MGTIFREVSAWQCTVTGQVVPSFKINFRRVKDEKKKKVKGDPKAMNNN